jgi:hypothetical protein
MMIVPGADDMQLTSQNDSASGSKENGRTRKSTGK